MAFAAVAATVAANTGKIAAVTNAVASLDAQGWTWFGLSCEGGGRRNEMTICNALSHDIELVRYYIHWGKVKIPPEPVLQSKTEDHSLFHNAGSWAATGSSGIITYKLQHDTYLHYMWDCPFNFDYSDNFVGLMLTSDSKLKNPDKALFKNMYMDGWSDLNLGKPRQDSYYDLVCCGPSAGDSCEAGGEGAWGFRRPCKVSNEYYEILSTMGDRHASTSKVVLCQKPNLKKPLQTDSVAKDVSLDDLSNRVPATPKPQLSAKPEISSSKPCTGIPIKPVAEIMPQNPMVTPTLQQASKPQKLVVKLPHQPYSATKNEIQDVINEKQSAKPTGCFGCLRLKSKKTDKS